MNPIHTEFLAYDRIADLRRSAGVGRGAGGSRKRPWIPRSASRLLAAALERLPRRVSQRVTARADW